MGILVLDDFNLLGRVDNTPYFRKVVGLYREHTFVITLSNVDDSGFKLDDIVCNNKYIRDYIEITFEDRCELYSRVMQMVEKDS